MPCCSWRLRPIGPPAPLLGGRRPRRRLCFPPPAEGCPGPAFIFFSCEALKLIPGLDHRPDCFVFPCGRLVKLWRVVQRTTYCTPPNGRPNPTSAGYNSRTLFENDVSNYLGAWSFVGANGQPGSMAIGNTLMLLTKPPNAQGGELQVFHIRPITKVPVDYSSPCEGVAFPNIAAAEPL
jgi:hypothetical protein